MIDVTVDQYLTTITINNPDKANALTADMLSDLQSAAESASTQKALIITGLGKVFSAGADLDAAKAGLATSPLWEELSGTIARLPCLTIAALNGTLAGGAFGMALACDIRIAVPNAKFFYPVMKLGFLPQPSDPVRLNALTGPAFAKRILMAGEKIAAEDALVNGLIDKIVEPDGLMEQANVLAKDALNADKRHVAAIKAMI
jgi:enoyl-CoA hydratase/carnithine racemase